ncbi:hypothetical protein N7512_001775 [Penicillium capsulatum]|nr:hypothetical protein N7512_001775 [Penicillium capsulatum]
MEYSRPQTVAVVGSGMAGLATAHLLHQDPQHRYRVTVLEKNENSAPTWADVPMRAFAGGFYRNLIRMYDHLGVQYHAQPFLFSFTRLPRLHLSSTAGSCIPSPQMIYASNFHQIPPVPRTVDVIHWLVEAVYAVVCYCWFTLCCFFIAPIAEDLRTGTPGESLDHYLRRIWLPQSYVTNYLLPLISSVCTCSHQELLRFPASDVIDYKCRTHRQQHFVVTAGVQRVQQELVKGLDVRLGVNLTHVVPKPGGVRIQYITADDQPAWEDFDRVVLAIPPDVAATLFAPVSAYLSAIPTTTVDTVAHTDESSIAPVLHATATSSSLKSTRARRNVIGNAAQRIHFFSNDSITEAVHEQPNAMLVSTNPLTPLDESRIIRSARFVRVLRNPYSRLLINSIFADRDQNPALDSWRNGDNGVHLAGGWCWDGMVLLEGCIVSAMRVATDLGVDVPWSTPP